MFKTTPTLRADDLHDLFGGGQASQVVLEVRQKVRENFLTFALGNVRSYADMAQVSTLWVKEGSRKGFEPAPFAVAALPTEDTVKRLPGADGGQIFAEKAVRHLPDAERGASGTRSPDQRFCL